jgi:alanine racemase
LKNVSIEPKRRAWVEVDLDALRSNFGSIADRLPPGCGILPMVKAEAYGIGLGRAVRTFTPLGPWGFGVATTEEGIAVRTLGWAGPIVVFSPTLPSDTRELVERRLEPVISGCDQLAACGVAARAVGASLPFHLEIDTGMGRFGLGWRDVERRAEEVADLLSFGGLRLRGTLTHFHSADSSVELTVAQWRRFLGALEALRTAGVETGIVHAANSAAALRYEEFSADLVRPGIRLYGGGAWEPEGHPVLAVRARVLDVREVEAGATVSYGATWTAPRAGRLATLGIGYGDGLRRELSNRGRVLIHGHSAPIRGAVCMDSTVVDIGERDDVQAGDVVTVLGRDLGAEIGLRELAELCGTIDYEILTGWSRRLPRIEIHERSGRSRSRSAHGERNARGRNNGNR